MLQALIERYIKDYRMINEYTDIETVAYKRLLKKVINDLKKVQKNYVGLKRVAVNVPTSTQTYFDSNTNLPSYNVDSGSGNQLSENKKVGMSFEDYWTSNACMENNNTTSSYPQQMYENYGKTPVQQQVQYPVQQQGKPEVGSVGDAINLSNTLVSKLMSEPPVVQDVVPLKYNPPIQQYAPTTMTPEMLKAKEDMMRLLNTDVSGLVATNLVSQ